MIRMMIVMKHNWQCSNPDIGALAVAAMTFMGMRMMRMVILVMMLISMEIVMTVAMPVMITAKTIMKTMVAEPQPTLVLALTELVMEKIMSILLGVVMIPTQLRYK